ncbi:MAG: hypothetical protein RLZZ519_698 [Bacteroidota bacterium]|jgi:hypothetical protein
MNGLMLYGIKRSALEAAGGRKAGGLHGSVVEPTAKQTSQPRTKPQPEKLFQDVLSKCKSKSGLL